MNDRLITIGTYSDLYVAELIKSKLCASGIEAIIVKDDCGGLHPAMQLGFGVNVKVRQQDMELANKILKSVLTPRQTRFEFKKNRDALISLAILILNAVGFALLVSGSTKYLKISGGLFLFSGIAVWGVRRFGKIHILRFIYSILSAGIVALLTAFLMWGIIVLLIPSANIDLSFNAIAVFSFIGGIFGFVSCFRLTRKLTREKDI